ncbi:MAG: carbohydrate-binding domain-containing protein [Alloprevotella sp.]|nr:carbohydrate-binding domain-containing protein [Alloprevotella sp.]
MKRSLYLLALALLATSMAVAQTLNVKVGSVVYQVPATDAGEMTYTDGTSLEVLGKTFSLSDITEIYVDQAEVTQNAVSVNYEGTTATVTVPSGLMSALTVSVTGADVSITQDESYAEEVTYTLSGSSTNGSFTQSGKLKSTFVLNGLSLTSLTGGAITIDNGKRINVEVTDGTTNTLVDAASGSQKACFFIKGHAEFSGAGTLNITGNAKHAYRSNEYTQLKKKFTGKLNILSAASDGIHVEEYFQQNAGDVVIKAVESDGIQVDYATDDDGAVEVSDDNTGQIVIKGGTLDITTTAAACKGLKAEGNVEIQGGTLTVTQSGDLEATSDLSYSTAVKSDKDINITGGTVTINNTAAGGKGLSADGNVNIDETNATTVIDIMANGKGGTAETTSSGETTEPAKSYKVYVSVPTSGGGGGPGGGGNSAWKTVYLYKSDGTLVQQLTSSVTKSSGYSTITFYYYDFKTAGDGTTTYYFKSDNYTSGGGWGGGTTYAIQSDSFLAPSDGQDIYYSITSSYTTSGTTRTYRISDVTTSYGGTSDLSEDSGTAYNAAGIKADGDITIAAGTVTVKNSGAMSKSLKSKATATISGGSVTLTPSGAMQVINSDASYSSGVKAADFLMSGGTLNITASGAAGKGISVTGMKQTGGTITMNVTGAGQTSSNNRYTSKGIKADGNLALDAGSLSITTTQAGAKGIKVNGAYTQGTSDGNGPTLYVSTSGGRYGSSSSSGGGWGGGMGGKTTGQGGAAKGVKVMGTLVIYGGETEIHTAADGGEGLESRTSIDIRGGQHYVATYDDGISCSGPISFNGGVTVAYSNGNDAVDSNYGRTGAISIGNGTVLAYSTKGGAEEGLDCDNNSYIQITGTGIAISAGGSQGGGGGWGGSSGSTISNAAQGYYFYTSSISYTANRYYTLADNSGKNLVTYSFPASVSSNLALFTATGMTKGSSYNVKYSTTAPTDATTSFHGLYLGSSATGSTSVVSFTAQ